MSDYLGVHYDNINMVISEHNVKFSLKIKVAA